ncbi:hypothetical protein F4808DRAFT_457238 [Astrocystis sublimbata]|nr:hypothetical protein F4808DRAFT_457238 [Astrocystis sublimbata]
MKLLLGRLYQKYSADVDNRILNYRGARQLNIGSGRLREDQDQLIKSVRATIKDFGDACKRLQGDIEVFMSGERSNEALERKIDMLIDLEPKLKAHIFWLEYFAGKEPDNVEALLQDAREFPVVPEVLVTGIWPLYPVQKWKGQ